MARVIDQVLGATTSSVVGEITRELVNSSDGQGLHFDGAAGNIDIASPPDLGTKASFELVISAATASQTAYIFDFGSSGRTILSLNSGSLRFYSGGWSDFSASTLDDLKVHHLVVTVDGTAATLYDNGNQIATATLAVNLTLDNAADLKIGSHHGGSADFFNGTIYRCRFYNKTLTSAEVQTAYERADVDYADQYGSQTNLVNPAANGDFSGAGNWVGQGNHSASIVSGELQVVASGASNGSSNAATLAATYGGTGTNGKVYKWEFTARASSGTPTLRARTPFDHSDVTTGSYKDFVLSTSNQTFSITGKRIALENAFFGLLEAGTFFIDNVKATQIGCVSDYDLAFANPTQSRTIQDRSTNNVDGTASTSGVTQVQPVVQGNLTSLAVQTSVVAPADGQIISKTQKWGASGDAGTITYDSNNAIVKGQSGKGLQLGGGNNVNVTIDTSGNVGVGDTTPTSPGGVARFVEISGTSASLVLTDSDSATWEWISAGGNLKAAKDGSDKVTIDSSGNVNVDGGGYVKIGPANTTAELRLYRDDATINAAGIAIGDINFGGADADNDNAARLRVKSDGAWTASSSPTAFEFQTCPSGSESLATRLVIDSDGDTTLSGKLKLEDASVAGWIQSNGSVRVDIDNDGSSTDRAFLVSRDNGSATLFSVNELGLAEFSGGIAFSQTNTSATGATASSTTLSHYEQGTFTPTDGSGAGLTFSSVSCNYTRVGRVVVLTGSFTFPTTSSSAQARVTVGTLPFSANGNSAGAITIATVSGGGGIDSAGYIRKEDNSVFQNSELSGGSLYFNTTYIV